MRGRQFFKMSGSGNDFVVIDARAEPPGPLANPEMIRAVCARGTGVGADGIVFLEPSEVAAFRMVYLNSDGSRAALCGNASLCVARLAVHLGIVDAHGFGFETDSGTVRARVDGSGPEIDLEPATDLAPGIAIETRPDEQRIGFARVGVPHLVVLVKDVDAVDVLGRGAELRRDPRLGRSGANVNFVAAIPGETPWAIRTFERGVEGETLACGTGAVASALMLQGWGLGGPETSLQTRSGRVLRVRTQSAGDSVTPSLGGEGRIVFSGELGEV